eukprot:scaffold66518_cov52-Phaeocystis_antarctica.AAC.3
MRQHRCCDRLESTRLRCTLHAAAMLFAPRLIVRDPADGMQRPAALVLHLLLRVCAHCCHHRLQRVCLHCLLPAVVRGVAGAAIAQAHKCVAAGALALTTSPQLRVCRHSCYNRPQCARLHCSLPDNLRRVANVRQHREAGGLHLHHLRVRPQRRHHRLQCARLCCTPPARLYRTILASTDVARRHPSLRPSGSAKPPRAGSSSRQALRHQHGRPTVRARAQRSAPRARPATTVSESAARAAARTRGARRGNARSAQSTATRGRCHR